MLTMVTVKYLVFSLFLVGSFARMYWGWSSSGEKFDGKRFVNTGIFTLFSSILPGAILAIGNIIVDTTGAFGLGLAALLLGWNTYNAQKALTAGSAKCCKEDK